MQILLGRDDVIPDSADKDGRAPLSWAAQFGHEEIVKMLLDLEDVTPDTVDKTGQTPLSWAAEGGHKRVEQLLLERCSVSPDILMTDPTSQPVRAWASEKQHGGAQRRQVENQGSVPRSEGGSVSMDLFPGDSSEPFQRPSKRIRRS